MTLIVSIFVNINVLKKHKKRTPNNVFTLLGVSIYTKFINIFYRLNILCHKDLLHFWFTFYLLFIHYFQINFLIFPFHFGTYLLPPYL